MSERWAAAIGERVELADAGPADAGPAEDTAAELLDWLAGNGVHLADSRGEVPYPAARAMVQRFLGGARRRAVFPVGVAPMLELARHRERPYE